MLKNFLNQPNALGRLLIVLFFAGGLVFAGTYDGFVVKTEAEKTSCCGGVPDAAPSDGAVAQPKASCCGSEETDVPSGATDAPSSLSEDDVCEDCQCEKTGCSDCTVKKCPDGCCGNSEDCGCTARCNEYDCSGDCFPDSGRSE